MSISKLFKVFAICCICSNIGYTMQEQNNNYELVQIIEFKWNSLPIMFEINPNSYIQGRYIKVSNDYNKYICDIWRRRINVFIKIGNKLDYEDKTVINKFRELSNRIKADGNWNNIDNTVHELFGNNYSILLLE